MKIIIKRMLGVLLLLGVINSPALAKTTINVNIGNNEPPTQGGEYGGPPKMYAWRPYEGRIPPMAVVGGQEPGQLLFVCQASFRGSVLPGKSFNGICNIGWHGQEITQNNFRLLVGRDFDWRRARHGMLPAGAVQGGFEHGMPLYVCRASYYGGGVHPGKLEGQTCIITFGGREYHMDRYEVLVQR
jgi:hypothetical protein